MADKWRTVWQSSFGAGAINAAAFEIFGGARAEQEKRDRYGSSNRMILNSLADEDFEIRLDGLDSRLVGILYQRGSYIIEPSDGIFFNTVKLTNVSATNSSADEVSITIARVEEVK